MSLQMVDVIHVSLNLHAEFPLLFIGEMNVNILTYLEFQLEDVIVNLGELYCHIHVTRI